MSTMYVTCHVCGRKIRLDDGRLNIHAEGSLPRRCKGSGQAVSVPDPDSAGLAMMTAALPDDPSKDTYAQAALRQRLGRRQRRQR